MAKQWYEEDEYSRAVANRVEELEAALASDYIELDRRYRMAVSAYERRHLGDLTGSAYAHAADENELHYNLHRSGVDTVHADIAGTSRPVGMFTTSGAEYKVRRRALRMEKFVIAQLSQPQGMFVDGWEVMIDALREALIAGTGIVKVLDDADSIRLERVPLHRLRVDLDEAADGDPRDFIQVGEMSRSTALEVFSDAEHPDAVEAAIMEAKAIDSKEALRLADRIRVVEAWHTPFDSSDDSGRHVIAINGCCVLDEQWDDPAPFVFIRLSKEVLGFWGVGLIEQGRPLVTEVNEMAAKFSARHRMLGHKRTYYTEGSINPNMLQESETETHIAVMPGNSLPVETPPTPVAPSEVEHLQINWNRYYELLGVQQMQASARKEPGITAGIAIRTMVDLGSKRQSIAAKRYEYAFCTLARRIVEAARRVASVSPGFSLPFPGNSFHEDIKWSDVDLDDSLYQIEVQPASSLPNTPQGRRQTLEEWFKAGIITPEEFRRLLKEPDLEAEDSALRAERDRIEWEISRMLDAPEEGFEMHTPDGYLMDLKGDAKMVAREYHTAVTHNAPEHVLALLRGYMEALDSLIKASQQPPPGPPPGAPGQGQPQAPPGPPGQMPPQQPVMAG